MRKAKAVALLLFGLAAIPAVLGDDAERADPTAQRRPTSNQVGDAGTSIYASGLPAVPGSLSPADGLARTTAHHGLRISRIGDVRTPIFASDLPLQITEPGSYYLAENAVSPFGDAITIEADDVTVDLRGFSLSAPNPYTAQCIVAVSGAERTTVKNGIVTECGSSPFDIQVAAINLGRRSHVVNVTAHYNTTGISVGDFSTVTDCIATDNYTTGIRTGRNSIVARCGAHRNAGIAGIDAGDGSLIVDSNASENYSDDGIQGRGAVLVSRCVANDNGLGVDVGVGSFVRDSKFFANSHTGILAGDNSYVMDNLVDGGSWGTYGITVGDDSQVLRNRVIRNSIGIHVIAQGNLLDGNATSDNDVGIRVDSANNVIVRNTAKNLTNFDIAPGNDVGPISSAASATSPWANIEF